MAITQPRSVPILNQLRRRAVEMRLAGATLAAVREETGLSIPTIIAAHKAHTEGGWDAVDTGRRGRPAQGQERLTPAVESALLHALLAGAPAADELPGRSVWDQQAIVEWLRALHGIDMPERNASRLIARRDLNAPSLLDEVRQSANPELASWLESDYARYRARARQAGARILWVGQRTLPSVGQHPPYHQMYAHSPRGHLQWLATPAAPAVQDWRRFLQGLAQADGAPLFLVLVNPYLLRPGVLGEWLAGQAGAVQTLLLPALVPTASPGQARNAKNSSTRSSMSTSLTHLQRLEAESIHIMREVVAETENPVMLYSIGKDSAVMLHLAMKAFYPAVPPFPLLHVDTRWKFRDMYAMRDRMAEQTGMKLLVHVNPDGVAKDINPFTHGSALPPDVMKTEGLKQALNQYGFDAAFGGARRDEEKSRAKERIFSFRTVAHQWDPKSQRPELWRLYNARKHKGESIRVFPLSNWTELDIWQYIYLENIPIVPLYFSALRPVVERDGTLIMVDDDRMPLVPGEVPMMKKVRFRTLGCYPLTGAIESEADTLPAIIQEMLLTRTSERQGRVIDHDSAASMEKKKQEGYF
jgi:sulfate adenylyltransferase subunit 2